MADFDDQQEPLPWSDSFDKVSDARKRELRGQLEGWDRDTEAVSKEQPGPFAGERLNGLEVFWLAACMMAGPSGDAGLAVGARPLRHFFHERSLPLQGADLSGAHLDEACLNSVDLRDADLREANLRGAYLHGADLEGAHLCNADLNGADLTKANLRGADVRGAHLRGALLRGTSLSDARLNGADLTTADLNIASLNAADLTDTRLVDANLRDVSLCNALLVRTDLRRATLSHCSVSGAVLWDVQHEDTEQANLWITPFNEPRIIIDDLDVAQFLAITQANALVRNIIEPRASAVVLILGRFPWHRQEALEALRTNLRARGYIPVVFDFGRPPNEQTTTLIALLTRLARFMVADIADFRSVRFQLATMSPHITASIQLLLLEGKATATDEELPIPSWVFPLYRYRTFNELLAALDEGVAC